MNRNEHCVGNASFTVAVFIPWNLAGFCRRLRLTGSCCIRLDAQGFAQRMFSIRNRIWGFARAGSGGRNQLLGLDLHPGVVAPQLHAHALSICPAENRRWCRNGAPWIWHLLEECARDVWECWSVVTGLISIVCLLLAALP